MQALQPANRAIARQSCSSLFKPVGIKSSPLLGRRGITRRSNTAVRANLEGFEDALFHTTSSISPSFLDQFAAHLSTAAFLADADPAAAADAAEAVADAASKKGGVFAIFSDSFEAFLKVIDNGLAAAHVPYSYGFAIITITLLVKLATYPLSAKQVESTLSMQALQPSVKELQAKFANDPERLQVETAKLYQTAGVNPLAGCLPTLATIPVFIGLYRALSNVADEGLLTEGFFWIPSLAGPTKLNGGLGWLTLVDGAPPLGWHDTISYLVLPVLLVVSQYASQKIISPQQNQDPSQQQANAILKFIPFMIGWFSLNVPSGLTLYWFTNNLVTTAQQVYLRRKFTADQAAIANAPTGVVYSGTTPLVKAKDEESEDEEKKPRGKDLNSRRSAKVVDVEVVGGPSSSSTTSPSSSQGGGGGGSRGQKFRAIKAREAAKKASTVASNTNGGSAAADKQEEESVPAAVHAEGVVEGEIVSNDEEESMSGGEEEQAVSAAGAKENGSGRGKQGGKKKKGGKK